MVDLDPRWVIKLIKMGEMEMMELYKRHVIDQALTLLKAHDDDQVPVHDAEAARGAVRARLAEEGRHHRRLLRRHRDDAAVPSLRGRGADGGRVLRADLRQHADGPRPRTEAAGPEDNWAIIYYPPAPRAMIEVVDPDAADRSSSTTARPAASRLTTLTKEFFMPRFLERDRVRARARRARSIRGTASATSARSPSSGRSSSKGSTEGQWLIPHAASADPAWGEPYKSLDVAKAVHYRTREPFVEVSQANLGLIRRDLLRSGRGRARRWPSCPFAELVAMSKRAAEHFLNDTLPLDPFERHDADAARTTSSRCRRRPACRTSTCAATC